MEILPEWNSWVLPMHALHWFGIKIENAEVLFKSSSMAYSCNVNLFNFSLTSLPRIVDPSPCGVHVGRQTVQVGFGDQT